MGGGQKRKSPELAEVSEPELTSAQKRVKTRRDNKAKKAALDKELENQPRGKLPAVKGNLRPTNISGVRKAALVAAAALANPGKCLRQG